MRIFDAAETAKLLDWKPLIEALRRQFADGCVMPQRHHHGFEIPGEDDGTLLLMPAWQPGGYMGVKQVSVVPGNSGRGLPAIFGIYVLSSAKTGEALALFDGAELTARRTAAASALAADYLARGDTRKHLIVGAGTLSLNLAQSHSAVRDLNEIMIWARRPEQAEAVAAAGRELGLPTEAVSDIEAAARDADIISCCTLSERPLVLGDWLKPGTHLDLVGAFKATMRETDDEAVRRSDVYVDTREGALSEGGDLVQAIEAGAMTADGIAADLYQLCQNEVSGRKSDDAITLFKSVGAALEDLAAAQLAYEVASSD